MNVYCCVSETYWHYYGGEYPPVDPPEPFCDCAIVAANTRAQAKYILWKNVHEEGYLLTEYKASIKKTGTIDKDTPGIIPYPDDGDYWI